MNEFFEIVANVAVLVFVVTCMMTAGLGVSVRDIVGPLRRARLVIFALVANFAIAPVIAYALTEIFAVDRPYATGLLLLSMAAGRHFCPSSPSWRKGTSRFRSALCYCWRSGPWCSCRSFCRY